MTEFGKLTAAVIGTGFIGGVHIGALRRLGIRVAGVLGSSPERGAKRAAELGVERAYRDLDELAADPGIDVVHVTSPNSAHYEHVKVLIAAGKHVVCEKPLALTSAQSAEMRDLARASDRVTAICYNVRFYPLNQHMAASVANGDIGDIRLVTGSYHQDWLAHETDWNWRLETDEGGQLRSVGDIGTHWIDLTCFITGQRPTAVFADLMNFIPERQRPLGPVETFSKDSSGTTEPRKIETDDAAAILLRYPNGARGIMSTSQVSHGRKNALSWDIAGASGSAAWHSETPDHLWLGHRDAPNQVLQRDPGMMSAAGAAAAALPGGHVEGFADSFRAFFAQVYADVLAGGRQKTSTYAGFDDGHFEMVFCDAVLESARTGGWVEIARG